jgi:NCAIR mutase (PurE)-related protein
VWSSRRTCEDAGVDEAELRSLLDGVRTGAIEPDEAVARLRRLPFADLGFARVDHHRSLRQGLPEAVYGPGKTAAQCVALVGELLAEPGGPVILTRADDEQLAAVVDAHPGAVVYGERRPLVAWRPADPVPGRVLVVAAGTADGPVAEECAGALTALGHPPQRLTDVGVAGIHRLLADADRLLGADAVVVVAGMEGALASVVGGLTGAPVVAVPTSTGYGAGLEGVTALLSMLASCAAGLTVVGIDNGFGAACAIARMLGTTSRVHG